MCHRFILTLLSIFVLFCKNSSSQNLINNPGFEEYLECPKDKLNNHINTHGISGWSGGGDYWNLCGYYYKEPRTGNGVAELLLFSTNPNFRSNTLRGKLTSTLIKDQLYYFEMYACYSTHFSSGLVAIDAIDVGFIENLKTKIDSVFVTPISNPKGEIITDSVNWTKITGFYKAKGNEQYIMIGNFRPRKEVKFVIIRPYHLRKKEKRDHLKSFVNGQYYFDDLLLTPVSDSTYH